MKTAVILISAKTYWKNTHLSQIQFFLPPLLHLLQNDLHVSCYLIWSNWVHFLNVSLKVNLRSSLCLAPGHCRCFRVALCQSCKDEKPTFTQNIQLPTTGSGYLKEFLESSYWYTPPPALLMFGTKENVKKRWHCHWGVGEGVPQYPFNLN